MTWKQEEGDDLTMTDCIRACKALIDAVDGYMAALKARDWADGHDDATDDEREEELLDVINSCLAQRWTTDL
jgi:hypothetical protein